LPRSLMKVKISPLRASTYKGKVWYRPKKARNARRIHQTAQRICAAAVSNLAPKGYYALPIENKATRVVSRTSER
jgi:hypothetical protein